MERLTFDEHDSSVYDGPITDDLAPPPISSAGTDHEPRLRE